MSAQKSLGSFWSRHLVFKRERAHFATSLVVRSLRELRIARGLPGRDVGFNPWRLDLHKTSGGQQEKWQESNSVSETMSNLNLLSVRKRQKGRRPVFLLYSGLEQGKM